MALETADSPALLLLDLPPAALIGIDILSFTSTTKFRGIKNLPPGFHFAFVGSSTAFSERHGVWFEIPSRTATSDPPLVVTRWDATTESLVLMNDHAEILQQRANLGSIWREGLAPYRQQSTNTSSLTDTTQQETSDWPSLTSSITSALLSRITKSWHLSSASSSKADLEAIPGITISDLNHSGEDEDTELHFLPIDLKQTWREGATGRERTDAAQDRSWALENLILQHCSGRKEDEIVGELQFCFLMILTLNNFSSLEQWKRILSLLFTCKAAVPKQPDLFISAIATLRLQLQHCKDAEGGLIDLADEGGSLLKSLLIRFRKGLENLASSNAIDLDVDVDIQDVIDELDDLEDYLRTEHGWQFGGSFAKSGVLELEDGEQVRMDTTAYDEEDESGEFAPQVVDLTTEQKRLFGVGDEVVLHEKLGEVGLGEEGGGVGAGAGGKGLQVEEASSGSETEVEGESESDNEEEEMDDLDGMDARY